MPIALKEAFNANPAATDTMTAGRRLPPSKMEQNPLVASPQLSSLSKRLETNMQSKTRCRVYNYKPTGRVEYDEFYVNRSKLIIDETDTVLAQHYGFTDEELDFIINYDIKYRMGRER